MLLPRRILALMAGLATLWFVGCAKDAGIDSGGGAGGSSGGSGDSGVGGGKDGGIAGGDGGWPTGGFGSSCTTNKDCTKGECVDIGQNGTHFACVWACDPTKGCPSNGYCAFHPDKGYLCLPAAGNECAKCTVDSECPFVGDHCARSPNVDRFCARDCSFAQDCPTGFNCVDVGSYPPNAPPPAPDGGAPDSGSGEAGPPTKPQKMCVPANDESCPCDTQRDGVKRRCTKTSGSLTCEGTETCNGSTTKWEGCTAGSPQPEVCDGADNDCNGKVDDGDTTAMCAAQGTPAHAKWACVFGACEIGSCDPGWAAYPPGAPSAGCTCAVDAAEPNDVCAKAYAAGSVTDANTTALTIKGTLSADTDVDWWKLDTVDSDEGTTNSYHIKIVFSAPTKNDEFVFDVERGDPCSNNPDANHSNLTSYDWCVDGVGTVGGKTVGEKTCSSTGPIHCGPHSKPYYVRVRRKAGATATCTQYTLTVTAKGTGNCDFTQACDPQVNDAP